MTVLQNNDSYIGQLLIRDGMITTDELLRGLDEQKKNKDFLCSNLVRLGFASEEKIFSILSLQMGVPYVNLKDIKVDPMALTRIPGSLALALRCLPLKFVENIFYVTMTDPLNARAVEEIKAYLGIQKVKIFLSGETDIREAIKKYYGL
jgi:hypothetical protein